MPARKAGVGSKLIILTSLSLVFFAGITFYLFNVIYEAQPDPIVDEIFHIRQAANYCAGRFDEYDAKITTLPGLYLLSVGVLKPMSWILGKEVISGVYALRFTNFIACLFNFVLLFALEIRILPYEQDMAHVCAALLSAVNMAMFPVLYFFTFLYYTDPCSTTLVLLMYLLHLENCQGTAAIIATVAFAVRQTNIVWLGLLMLLGLEEIWMRRFMQDVRVSPATQRSYQYLQILVDTMMSALKRANSPVLVFLLLTFDLIYYGSVCFLFMVFLFVNGGSIVVGDKGAHGAVLNYPQLLYFSMFATFFCFPYFIKNIDIFIKCIFRNKGKSILCFMVLSCIVYFNTHVHPYTLADNRHYTFYLWRRIYEYHFSVKYFLLPVSMFGMFSIYHALSHTNFMFQAGYVICILACLVPQKLLEVRYFILPFLFLRIHINRKEWWQLIVEFLFFSSVNAFTIFTFVQREFYWDDSDEIQRIMW